MRRETIVGAVIAGGLSRRMGGGDKPLQLLGGRSILDHVLDRFAPQCDAVVINANGDARRLESYRLPVVADPVAGFAGPLAGLLAALEWASANRPDAVLVATVPGDCPFLPRDLVERLSAARRSAGAEMALASSDGRPHPVAGLWSPALRTDLRQALEEENLRKVAAWTERHSIARADWPVEPIDPFFNVNTPGDLAQAESLLRLMPD
ncbi:molybdenum cofactor guanylyltransferase MobA [Aquibium microcysteis]|uniref:molybdenum cofactor guanylyltransferase MobA n=1 Tax=Aquibium microcysteis TaxID=675281 RepID=UPI00165D0B5E|nr:molybdenum cofactor guanylyltransferase MobA [Aquibium microcysteis]